MIDFQNVHKNYGAQDLFVDASFRINKGERAGIVGPNGSGKSTIFGMLTGEVSPDKGSVGVLAGVRMGHLRQQVGDSDGGAPLIEYVSSCLPEVARITREMHEAEAELARAEGPRQKTLLDKLGKLQTEFESIGGYRLKSEGERALAGLGFSQDDMKKPFSSFSSGWQMRASLAQILISNPDLLLLDEPSNYLDVPAVEWLHRFLKSYQGTLVLISHDRYLLKTLTDVTIEVNNGQTTRYPGDYDYYVRERESRARLLEAEKANQDKMIDRLQKSIDRFRAKSSKASQVQSWIKTLDKIDRVSVPDNLNYSGRIKIPPAPHSGHEVMRVEDAGLSYDGSRWILRKVSLSVARGEKIGVVGYNGTGKSTLLKVLAGRMPPTEGGRVEGHKVVVGYQAQDFGEIFSPDSTVFDTVRAAAPAASTAQQVRNILGSFGFSGEAMEKRCGVLSGGEKIRLSFASIFVNPPNFLILDEPTTHLDIAARETLQQAIRTYDGSVCLVSHDIEFLRNSVDTIISMESPGVRRFPGNYDYYREKTLAEAAGRDSADDNDPSRAPNPESLKFRRQERAAKRQEVLKFKRAAEKEVARLEETLAKLEAEKKELVALFSGGGNVDFETVGSRLREIDDSIAAATSQWEEKALALEEINADYEKIHA